MKETARQKPNTKTNRWGWIIGGFFLVLIAFFALMFTQMAPDYPAEVTTQQAFEKREAGAFVLDVRQPEEWNAGHIPGATLIPLGDLPARLNEVPKDKEVVVVCRSGNRSATGRDILRDAGWEKVTSMSGGMNTWSSGGFPVVTGP